MKAHQPAAPVVHRLTGEWAGGQFSPDDFHPCGAPFDPRGLHSRNPFRVTCPGCKPARSTATPVEGAAA